MKTMLTAAAGALALLCAGEACAQTLYKLIDRNGKVTYAEKPPRDFDGKVIPLEIDPNRNTATLPKPPPKPEPVVKGREELQMEPAPKPDNPVDVARRKLEAARKALEKARDNPAESDMRFIGVVGGGTRRVPTQEYAARLEELERRVKSAEEELAAAERGR